MRILVMLFFFLSSGHFGPPSTAFGRVTLELLGMRILVMLLLDTLPMLGNVLLLCFFVFFIFGKMMGWIITFSVWLPSRLLSAGLEPVIRQTENHIQHRITDNFLRILKKIIKPIPVLFVRAFSPSGGLQNWF